MRRDYIRKDTRIAALIGDLLKIPLDERRVMTEKEMLSLVDWDHIIPVACGGTNHHSNFQALRHADHVAKTARYDRRFINRVKKREREERKIVENRHKLLAPAAKPFKREPTHRRKMNGQVVRIETERA